MFSWIYKNILGVDFKRQRGSYCTLPYNALFCFSSFAYRSFSVDEEDSTMILNMKKQGQLETIEVMLERNKSVGSVPSKSIGTASIKVLPHTHRSKSKVMKWLKKTLIKLKN